MSDISEKNWVQIAVGSADVISAELLRWSKLSDLWNRYELDNHYDFLSDVARTCNYIHIEYEDLDDVPTHTWKIYYIETNQPKTLRWEMENRVNTLIAEISKLDIL